MYNVDICTLYIINCAAHIAIYLKNWMRKFCWQPPRPTCTPKDKGHGYHLIHASLTRAFTVKHRTVSSLNFSFLMFPQYASTNSYSYFVISGKRVVTRIVVEL